MNEHQRELLKLADNAQEALSVGNYELVAELDEAYVTLAESEGGDAYSSNYVFAVRRMYHWHKRQFYWTGDPRHEVKAAEYLARFIAEGGDGEKLQAEHVPFI